MTGAIFFDAVVVLMVEADGDARHKFPIDQTISFQFSLHRFVTTTKDHTFTELDCWVTMQPLAVLVHIFGPLLPVFMLCETNHFLDMSAQFMHFMRKLICILSKIVN